jgi:hypothetical protein
MKCAKKAFKDHESAIKALHRILNKDDGRKKPIRAYECEKCQQWHLTSEPIDKKQNTNYRPRLDWSKLINK